MKNNEVKLPVNDPRLVRPFPRVTCTLEIDPDGIITTPMG